MAQIVVQGDGGEESPPFTGREQLAVHHASFYHGGIGACKPMPVNQDGHPKNGKWLEARSILFALQPPIPAPVLDVIQLEGLKGASGIGRVHLQRKLVRLGFHDGDADALTREGKAPLHRLLAIFHRDQHWSLGHHHTGL